MAIANSQIVAETVAVMFRTVTHPLSLCHHLVVRSKILHHFLAIRGSDGDIVKGNGLEREKELIAKHEPSSSKTEVGVGRGRQFEER